MYWFPFPDFEDKNGWEEVIDLSKAAVRSSSTVHLHVPFGEVGHKYSALSKPSTQPKRSRTAAAADNDCSGRGDRGRMTIGAERTKCIKCTCNLSSWFRWALRFTQCTNTKFRKVQLFRCLGSSLRKEDKIPSSNHKSTPHLDELSSHILWIWFPSTWRVLVGVK